MSDFDCVWRVKPRLGLSVGWMVLIIQCEGMKVVSKTHWQIKYLCAVTKRLSQQTYLDLVMISRNYRIQRRSG